MERARASDGAFERGDEARFTGEVWLRSMLTADDATNIGVVHFSPTARTRWHRHPGGQFLSTASPGAAASGPGERRGTFWSRAT